MKILKSKKLYVLIAVILLASYFVYAKYYTTPKIEYNTTKAQLGTLTQTITESGTVKKIMEVNLNFLAQGRIATTTVKNGDKVKKDQILAELDYSNLKIQARQAEAGLEIAKANQQKTLNGAVSTDVNISQKNSKQAEEAYKNSLNDYINTKATLDEGVAQAEKNYNDLLKMNGSLPIITSLNTAKKNLENTQKTNQKNIANKISSGIISVNDKNIAAKTALDSVKRVLTDDNAKDTLSITDQSKLVSANENLSEAQKKITTANLSFQEANDSKSASDLENALADTASLLDSTLDALNFTFESLTNTITSSKLTQASLDTLKNTISAQISTISAAVTLIDATKQSLSDTMLNYDNAVSAAELNFNTAQANYDSALLNAKNILNSAKLNRTQQLQSLQSRVDNNLTAWQISQSQLSKTTQGSRPEDLALAAAQVKQAQANLDSVNNQINNNIIKAPFDGEVTQVNYEVGEEPNATKPVIVLVGKDLYEIEVLVAESDIAKVAIGNPVSIDFDAFGESVKFDGVLQQIDPAQTVIQEVVYYKANVSLNASTTSQDYLRKIRPGMTANLTILANTKNNVVTIPLRAVLDQDGKKIVRLLKNSLVSEVPVELGLRGDEGLVEVTSGVSPNDEVILSIKNPTN